MSISEDRRKKNREQMEYGKQLRLRATALKEEGKSNAEIAQIMAIPESIVRKLVPVEDSENNT